MTPDLVYDQMIGAGCAKKLIFSWGGNQGVGSLHRLRDAVEKGWPNKLEILEHSHAAMANAYRSEEHTSELQSRPHLVCRLLLHNKKPKQTTHGAPDAP